MNFYNGTSNVRQCGKTTALIQYLEKEPQAVLIVGNQHEAERLDHKYPNLRGRFISVHIAGDRLRSSTVQAVWDHYAAEFVAQVANEQRHDIQKLKQQLASLKEKLAFYQEKALKDVYFKDEHEAEQ